ncbi:MAG TPA: hypothetical protein VGL65_08495 [Gemmatimonadales bacterium]
MREETVALASGAMATPGDFPHPQTTRLLDQNFPQIKMLFAT